MKVESIMTRKPILAKVPGKREDVLNLMIRHKKTGLPVTKKDGTLVGLVARKHLFQKPDETQLAMLVRKDHPSIEKDVDVADAAKLILDNDLHQLRPRTFSVSSRTWIRRSLQSTTSGPAASPLTRTRP
jgi:predicted transcriptional regulator